MSSSKASRPEDAFASKYSLVINALFPAVLISVLVSEGAVIVPFFKIVKALLRLPSLIPLPTKLTPSAF